MQTEGTGTAGQILDVAERLVQTRGFNYFSYADIAAELALTKPALHYHFRSKALLGEALISRYTDRFFGALNTIDSAGADAQTRLDRFIALYRTMLSSGRMCLCGVFAAEYPTLPPAMCVAVLDFFDRNETWLEAVLRQGVAEQTMVVAEPARDVARMIIDTVEGATMIARAHDDPERFNRVTEQMLSALRA